MIYYLPYNLSQPTKVLSEEDTSISKYDNQLQKLSIDKFQHKLIKEYCHALYKTGLIH